MILARLFGELFAKGCVLVATSNVEPDNLYRDGLNRGLFLPFIDLLKANAEIISLDTETDYRLGKTDGAPVWLSPLGPETEAAMHKIQDRPVAIGGQVVIRPMMYLALSYDHRIVDGKEAVTFLVRVKESLEDPERLVLDL